MFQPTRRPADSNARATAPAGGGGDTRLPSATTDTTAGRKRQRRDITSIKQFKNHLYQHALPQFHAMVERNPTLMYPPAGILEAREQKRLADFLKECEGLSGAVDPNNNSSPNSGDPAVPYGSVRASLYPVQPHQETLAEIHNFLAEYDRQEGGDNNNNNNNNVIPASDAQGVDEPTAAASESPPPPPARPLTEAEKVEAQLRARWEALQQRRQQQRAANASLPSHEHHQHHYSDEDLAKYHHTQLNALIRLFYEFNHNEFVKIPVKQTLDLLARCGRESIAHLTEFELQEREEKKRRREARMQQSDAFKRQAAEREASRDLALETELEEAEKRATQIANESLVVYLEDGEAATTSDNRAHQQLLLSAESDMCRPPVVSREEEEGLRDDDADDEYAMLREAMPSGDDVLVEDTFKAMYGADFDS